MNIRPLYSSLSAIICVAIAPIPLQAREAPAASGSATGGFGEAFAKSSQSASTPAPSSASTEAAAASDSAAKASAENSAKDPWGIAGSDIPIDPAWHLGQLDNGMRYIIRSNATPEGQALVRLRIGSGRLEERDDERGAAHYVEHMVFNGTTNVPEGEMIKLLERKGLAFGADTNAHTGFDETVYKLDLPKNSDDLLNTALMLMRETASEVLFAPAAVERERGVILAELRARDTFRRRDNYDRVQFQYPGSRFSAGYPDGDPKPTETITPEILRRYYKREYVPANAVLTVIGDYPVAEVEKQIKAKFSDWQAAPPPEHPSAGPIATDLQGQTDIYLDPALPEQVVFTQNLAYEDKPDTAEQRRKNVITGLGYRIINRRLASLARGDNPPFIDAGFGDSEIYKAGRSTRLAVVTEDGKWQAGVDALVPVWRATMRYGFTKAELAEQIARTRKALENGAEGESTRSNGALYGAANALAVDQRVPSTPSSALERFNSFADDITPEMVLAALREDTAALDNPMIRFSGKAAPKGGEQALRKAWQSALAIAIAPPAEKEAAQFGYSDFGEPGTVVSDKVDPRLGIREIRFANGVRLNLKKTDLKKDRISFRANIDGGDLLKTAEQPRITELVSFLPAGGLGKHTADELTTILAGRTVSNGVSSAAETFSMGGTTTPDDLELQLQLIAAGLTDAAYRKSAEDKFHSIVPVILAQYSATPGNAYSTGIGAIISDNDPRFSTGGEADYLALTFDQMRPVVEERFQNGAMEIGLVGDLDEEEAVAMVAKTLGALPKREAEFQPRPEARERGFTDKRGVQIIRHSGNAKESLLSFVWPTTDYEDLKLARQMGLLAKTLELMLVEELRERLGDTYSPGASSSMSSTYPGYGTLNAYSSVDVNNIDAVSDAIISVVERLRSAPVDDDLLKRAREPILESYANALKTNGGWLARVARAQSKSEYIDRFLASPDIIKATTGEDLQKLALQYLDPAKALQIRVLPQEQEGVSEPADETG